MTRSGSITVLACVGEMLLLVLVLWRGKRTRLWGPLVALSGVVFAWNFTGLAWTVSADNRWHWVDITFSPMTTPTALHLVLAFTGRRRQLRRVRQLAYAWFVPLSLVGPAALLWPQVRWLYLGGAVPIAHLIGAVIFMALALVLLVLHLRASHDPAERTRTRMLLAALAIATPMALTELLNEVGVQLPHLGSLGILVGNSLVVLVVLRLRLFDRSLTASDALFAGALAALAVGLYLAVFQTLGTNSAVLVFATATLTLVLAAGLRQVLLGMRQQRDQLEQLAQLGRMSAQLGHDLKNPLAALRGAAQFLEGELAAGRAVDEHRHFLTLIVEQADRMQRVIDDYRRLGRMEPSPGTIDLNAVLKDALALQPFAAGGAIRLTQRFAPELPVCRADPDLIGNAVHNLLRNACEAMHGGGDLLVESLVRSAGDARWAVLAVEDTGTGMDARTKEKAFDEFFTTRPTGSGLGLSLVKRVAQAHGGRVVLDSHEGKGTRVELWLPAGAE